MVITQKKLLCKFRYEFNCGKEKGGAHLFGK